ncbi:TonB-dependent receptor [Flavobacterium jejuense]|uniref:TonB-dependent receptor n=1 Tax=Flavobacterium jejuense TaxID=1544455 RepID=A0ABX0IM14_9FLAO|nr:TonB-dependent receptor [Flavobacterium jejuense]NHN24832.1 TonB-dependent receptor [Flavobacterium jejuense]
MTSKVFSLLILLLSISSFAQKSVKGLVTDTNQKALENVEIYNKTTYKNYFSNANGEFVINAFAKGKNTIVFFLRGYKIKEVIIDEDFESFTVSLEELTTSLSEVVIIKEKEKQFALNKLKDIEETAIYAGKKTEVISLDKITANKATNNPRQVYAQVVGLTINESNDGGLQLSIGGRGLNPNRTSNFNTRQNDYDISADVLGYPESYYATPTEALESIQIVRGAASLQYGTQFGGLVNFKIKRPSLKPIEIVTRNTIGSYNLFTNFTSISGTKNKFSYFSFYNFKKGDGFRPNSKFDSKSFFVNLNYQFTKNTSLHFDYTFFDYLAQQPGGLTDVMFEEDPKQSNRARNWFDVNWNLFALRFKHHFENNADFSLQLFGLNASRKALGFRSNRVSSQDVDGTVRDLIIGDFVNWGAEARYLKKYTFFGKTNAFLIGAKYYQAENSGEQGPGSSGKEADFNIASAEFPNYANQSKYTYPNLNFSIFGENIFKLSKSFSITPGFRYENIKTQANGFYRKINTDLAGNVLFDETITEENVKERQFFLFGIGLSYKMKNGLELYGNVSQNYRSVTFNDIRTAAPSFEISEDITDEKGYTSDIGVRGKILDNVSFDASIYALYYNDKIGESFILSPTQAVPVRFRDNIGTALTYGLESLVDWNIGKTFFRDNDNFIWTVFSNFALTDSEYIKSELDAVKGNKVEFVPNYNLKLGTGIGYKNFLSSLQFTYVSSQFTDALNNKSDTNDNTFGIFGEIPAYHVLDFSTSYKWKKLKFETGINNVLNTWYFTKRATGYPGPGIIPSEPRVFYATIEFKF